MHLKPNEAAQYFTVISFVFQLSFVEVWEKLHDFVCYSAKEA